MVDFDGLPSRLAFQARGGPAPPARAQRQWRLRPGLDRLGVGSAIRCQSHLEVRDAGAILYMVPPTIADAHAGACTHASVLEYDNSLEGHRLSASGSESENAA